MSRDKISKESRVEVRELLRNSSFYSFSFPQMQSSMQSFRIFADLYLGDVTLWGKLCVAVFALCFLTHYNPREEGSSMYSTYKIMERTSKKYNCFLNINSDFQLST